MMSAFLCQRRRSGGRLLVHSTKYDSAGLHVDLLGPESGVEPLLRHHVVRGVVAPPRGVLRGVWRQLASNDPFNFRERHRNFLVALGTQELAQTAVLTHGTAPLLPQNTTKYF